MQGGTDSRRGEGAYIYLTATLSCHQGGGHIPGTMVDCLLFLGQIGSRWKCRHQRPFAGDWAGVKCEASSRHSNELKGVPDPSTHPCGFGQTFRLAFAAAFVLFTLGFLRLQQTQPFQNLAFITWSFCRLLQKVGI